MSSFLTTSLSYLIRTGSEKKKKCNTFNKIMYVSEESPFGVNKFLFYKFIADTLIGMLQRRKEQM